MCKLLCIPFVKEHYKNNFQKQRSTRCSNSTLVSIQLLENYSFRYYQGKKHLFLSLSLRLSDERYAQAITMSRRDKLPLQCNWVVFAYAFVSCSLLYLILFTSRRVSIGFTQFLTKHIYMILYFLNQTINSSDIIFVVQQICTKVCSLRFPCSKRSRCIFTILYDE